MTDCTTNLLHHYSPMSHGYTGTGHGYGQGTGYEHLILANQIADGTSSTADKIHNASINGIQETSNAARDTVDAIRDGITATNQIGNINLQSTERNGGETRSSVERTAGETRDSINFAANQTGRDFAGVHRDLCQSRQEQSEGFGNTNLEVSKGFGATQLEMSKQHCEIKLEMTKQHCNLERQIDARAAEAAKALADCCCELKEQHAQTRALIAATDSKRIEQENANLRQDLLLAKINGGGNGGPPFGN